MEGGRRYLVATPFQFRRCGRAGIEISEHFHRVGAMADEICFYRGAVGESTNHPTALYHLNTGNVFGGDPAMGAWIAYGLGTLNENLPAFVVLPDLQYPQGGTANWSNGFLPAYYQGAALRPSGSPILDMDPPPGTTREHQRANLDFLAELNRMHQRKHPEHAELAARIENYELAFRMQAGMPGAVAIDREPEDRKSVV